MEKQPQSGSEQKTQEYTERIINGEPKDLIFQDLPKSFQSAIEDKLLKNKEDDKKKIEELRKQLGIAESVESEKSAQEIPINYIDVTIDDDYMQKNLMPNGGLRMAGGQANWNGQVDLMRYAISDNISPKYRQIAQEKIDKFQSGQEKTYQHESHHIQNRENGLTPHLAAKNLREFLAFRVLDEMSAFVAGELHGHDITADNILHALQSAERDISDSYYGRPFTKDAAWHLSQHGNEPEVFSRKIDQEKYHRIMRQYFNIDGQDILAVLQKAGKISEFTKIVDSLIIKLDKLLDEMKEGH